MTSLKINQTYNNTNNNVTCQRNWSDYLQHLMFTHKGLACLRERLHHPSLHFWLVHASSHSRRIRLWMHLCFVRRGACFNVLSEWFIYENDMQINLTEKTLAEQPPALFKYSPAAAGTVVLCFWAVWTSRWNGFRSFSLMSVTARVDDGVNIVLFCV